MIDLVTGATGFVGSHLVEELRRRGRTVRCTVRRTSDRKRLGDAQTVEADLADGPLPPSAFDGVERVFHLAGVVFGTDEQFDRGNRRATQNLVASLRPVRRLVHVSTLAVTGPSSDGTPLDESAPTRPVSVYGRTKLAGERAASAASVPVTVIRPPVVYGPRDRGLLSFFQAAARGIRPILPGERRFSIIHVEDLARGIADAAESPPGRVYFLANAEAPSFTEMTARILRAMGRRKAISARMSFLLMHEAAALVELARLNVPLSRDKVRELKRPFWTCSAAAAARDFGWTPRIGLDEGIRATVEWYRAERWI
jgi:nucleoside-diphosphate-sugar epimerase